jgi:invasion protein IalB
MKKKKILASAAVCSVLLSGVAVAAQATDDNQPKVPPSPNGIAFPADYRDWRVISISHRTDHHSMRAILGNDIAIEAA